ncbi:hypothetical protein CRG98_018580 [Punica granatum]|nr:hypothetical protein CRG98_018580 [Punica granatum]
MEEADYINSRRIRPSFSKMRFSKVKVKIGNRLRNLRRRMMLAISVAGAGTYRQMARQLKACRRLFGARQANTRLPALLI